MASFIYPSAREAFLNGDLDWAADTIKLLLVEATYAPTSSTTHDFLDDIPSGDRVSGSVSSAFSSKTATGGTADAADVVLTAVPAGTAATALVIYKDTGSEATSRLIAYIDSYSGLPITPNGGDITVTWPNGANKIFTL